jgi:acyl-CoA thioester hydrolase
MTADRHFPAGGLEFCCAVTPEARMMDYNGHLNVACYGLLFEDAARAIFPRLDISQAYRERTHNAFFAAELHQVFHREVTEGEAVSLYCRIVDFDGRKLHVMFFMVKSDGALAASQEILYLHVAHASRRVVAVPEPQAARLRELKVKHESLPPSADAGRHVGIRRQQAGAAPDSEVRR